MPLLRAALSWNFVLVTAVCASLLAQLIKVLLNLFIFHRFIAERMWGAGGMPSAHSATTCAMAITALLTCGFQSAEFAIACILTVIVIYDATGVRWEASLHARALNLLIDELDDEDRKSVV